MMGMKTSRPTWVGEIGGGGGDRLAWESLDLRSNVDRVKEQKQEECEASRREVDQVKQLQVQALVDSLSIATTALQNEDAKRAEALMDAEEARALVRQHGRIDPWRTTCPATRLMTRPGYPAEFCFSLG
uniref:Uncharacterized protein n=1 Tax=Chromera velia CCMP2878 TaxID=1169474 RepID=A0A0K6S8N0_9ALVE|eukprot:Cvel_25638.t1-p1 / transcript=Cvel_25638.t1 / gene=Cvel_25638 / organism=Chromera_velia_CCMP2878 / gene_product=hypothetical protein / transcript_product=hypothetical protein / location=Cvel_scaffold2932:2485-3395(-) / protein_length=128 / sequence_SO=supercontig / SO=protein_coding / is_pseudo=false